MSVHAALARRGRSGPRRPGHLGWLSVRTSAAREGERSKLRFRSPARIRRPLSTPGLAVDLLSDDVGVAGMSGGLVDDREDRPTKIARLAGVVHRRGGVSERADDR